MSQTNGAAKRRAQSRDQHEAPLRSLRIESYSPHGKKERQVLACIIHDDAALAAIANWPDRNPFASDEANVIARCCLAHFKRHKTAPGEKKLAARLERWSEDQQGPSGAALVESVDRLASGIVQAFPAPPMGAEECADVAETCFQWTWKGRWNERYEVARLHGRDPADLAKLDAERMPTLKNKARERFPLVSTYDLLHGEIERDPYHIENVLAFGQPCLIAGAMKTMKTSVALDLAWSLASGEPFLGALPVVRTANVLLLSGESSSATVMRNSRAIVAAKMGTTRRGRTKLPQRLQREVTYCRKLPMITNAADLALLRELMQELETGALVLDTANRCMDTQGKEHSVMAMGAMLMPITELCEDLGVTLILLHHTKRTVADPKSHAQLEDIAWPGFAEWARQWMLLSRREAYLPGTGRHSLWLNAGGSAGHSRLWGLDIDEGTDDARRWEIGLAAAGEARQKDREVKQDRRQRDEAELVLAELRQRPDTKTGLRARLGKSTPRLGAVLELLLAEGRIEAAKITHKRGNPEGYAAVE